MDAWGWIVAVIQGLLSSWFFKLGEIIAVPYVVRKVVTKKDRIEWSLPRMIVLGLIVFASILVIHDHAMKFLSSIRPDESLIRGWLDSLHYSTSVNRNDKDENFSIVASGDVNFRVFQSKDESDVILVETTVRPNKSTKEALDQMPPMDRRKLLRGLEIGLVELDIEMSIDHASGNVILNKHIPFDSTTSRTDFASQLFILKKARGLIDAYYDPVYLNLPKPKA